jgi:outer membrane protein assembly factor BamC
MNSIATKIAVTGFIALFVSGCGFIFGDDGIFRDRSEDYKKAPELPVVSVPEDKDSEALQELYAIPPVDESLVLTGEFEVPRPAPLVAGANEEMVRIQKLGDESWALIGAAPGQVWPQVRSFLSAAGIQVGRIDARQGIMETDWLELEGKPMASRFRFRIDQGVQRNTSELHILQMNQAGDIETWPAVSDSQQQEADMLRAVSQYLADSSDAAPISMIADQSISASGKVAIRQSADGGAYIELALPYERAWASLGRSLEKSGFEVTDRDRSGGKYYAQFVEKADEEEGGWFSWMFGGDDDQLERQNLLVNIRSVNEEIVNITLQAQEGETPLQPREEQGLLVLIKGNIQ